MAKVVRHNIKVKDLPPEFRLGLDAGPEDTVRVTIEAERARRVEAFLDLAHELSEEARRKGLTEEKRAELLNDPT